MPSYTWLLGQDPLLIWKIVFHDGKTVGHLRTWPTEYEPTAAAGNAFWNYLRRSRGYLHSSTFVFYTFTGFTAVFGPDMFNNTNDGWDEIKLLTYLFAYSAQLGTTLTDFFLCRYIVNYFDTW